VSIKLKGKVEKKKNLVRIQENMFTDLECASIPSPRLNVKSTCKCIFGHLIHIEKGALCPNCFLLLKKKTIVLNDQS